MFHRLFTLVRKELLTMLQDRQTRLILILPVLFQVLLFPFAATLELTNAPLAIYNEDNGPIANELIQRFSMAKTFSSVKLLRYPQQIKQVIDNQKVLAVIHFPANFSRHILHNQPTSLQVILDGRNSNSAQIAANYVQDIIRNYQLSLASSNATPLPQAVVIRNFYNPNLDYKWFMLPSLIAMITTTGVLTVTALSITREREQGTLDQLFVAPLTTWQIFIGKAIPASLVAMFQSTVVLLIGIFGYQIAFAGSLLLFYFSMAIYSLSLIGTGLLIASFSSTQQQAFIGVFAFIMPTILLSGSVAPIENMPQWLQYLTLANPIRHFTDISKELYLKDANLATIAHSLWPLLIIAVITSYLAYRLFRQKVQ